MIEDLSIVLQEVDSLKAELATLRPLPRKP